MRDRWWRGLTDSRAGVAGAVGLLGLAIAAVLVIELASLHDLSGSSKKADESLKVLATTTEAEKLVLDLETGLRGYALTAQARFLQPYEGARAALPHLERTLQGQLAPEPTSRAVARPLTSAIDAYVHEYAEPLVREAARNLPAVRSTARTALGKRRVDAIRSQFVALLADERNEASTRHAQAARVTRRAEVAAIIGLAGLLLLLTLCGLFLGHMVTREQIRARRERRVARTLQRGLLPESLPAVPGLAIAARFRPAGGFVVGGDFYDIFPAPGGWVVAIGDIAGKGPEAARLTAVARYTLRNEATRERAPSRLLKSANHSLRSVGEELALCTLACCVLSRDDGTFGLEIASAGHPLPMLLGSDGSCVEVGGRGMLLGLVDDPPLEDGSARLSAADSLVFYTDGLTDAHAPDRLIGRDEIAAAMAPLAGREPALIAERLEGLAGPRREARDDIAIIVVQNASSV